MSQSGVHGPASGPWGMSCAHDAAELVGASVDALAGVLLSDPMTGCFVALGDGRIAWSNDAADRMVLTEAERSEGPLGGRGMGDVFPEALLREFGVLEAHGSRGGEPAMLRVIWNDRELFVRVVRLPAGPDERDGPLTAYVLHWGHSGRSDLEAANPALSVIESLVARLDELDRLTTRELEVLALLSGGRSMREVADSLFRSEKTIQNHRDAIGTKLGLRNRVRLAEVACRAGLTVDDATRQRV